MYNIRDCGVTAFIFIIHQKLYYSVRKSISYMEYIFQGIYYGNDNLRHFKKAGVSIATVSRVLNGSENVRPSTRKKVMDVIDKYDYTPNAFARGMGLHSLKTIGFSVQTRLTFFSQRQSTFWSRNYRRTDTNHFYAVPVIIRTSRRITLI